MGFLVGNDFIPHLPHLHINHDALPMLYRTYMTVLPELGGKYIITTGYFFKVSCGAHTIIWWCSNVLERES